jgi:hypothetical protein
MRSLGILTALVVCLAALSAVAFGREEFKVSMEDVLKEITQMRRELRELKIQRDRDQRTIEDLRRIVDNGLPGQPMEMPRPAVARSTEGRPAPSKPPVKPVGHNTPQP